MDVPDKNDMPIGLRGVGINAFTETAEEGLRVTYIEAPETGELGRFLASKLREI